MTARQTAEDGVQEPRYSTWREVVALLWAVFWAGVCLVTLTYAVPWIAAWAGRQ